MRVRAMEGTASGARWGPRGAFPVLYLGRPRESVTVEAYRHLVEAVEGMTAEMIAARRLWVCDVSATHIVDLRSSEAQRAVGLDADALHSEVGDYARCQAVAAAAHQLGAHGILAPAATELGETLALFMRHLPANEMPHVTETIVWDTLPPDPRRLSIVDDETG